MIYFFPKYKIFFYLSNIILLSEYIYPGSLLGCIIFNDCTIQPKLTSDFIVSANHFYSFLVLSVVGLLTYIKLNQVFFLSIYLVFISFFLEIMHYLIPNRSFEYPDLFGNFIGVIVVVLFRYLLKKYENSKF